MVKKKRKRFAESRAQSVPIGIPIVKFVSDLNVDTIYKKFDVFNMHSYTHMQVLTHVE